MTKKLAIESRALKYFLIAWGSITSLFHVYIAMVGYYEPFVVIPVHVFLIGTLLFVSLDWKGEQRTTIKPSFIIDIILIIILAIVIYNPVHDPYGFQTKYASIDTSAWDKLCGLTMIILALEMVRRAVGKIMVFFVLIFLAYAVFGRYLPGLLRHKGMSILKVAEYQFFMDLGIWSIARIIAMYVVLFIIFGSVINAAKGGLCIQRLGNWLFGTSPGGPAKVAIVTSSAFASISGSAVANVVTTGSFTIPMMKKVGYPAHVAGAIEAAASSGGQIMPPVMGAVAFVMADALGVPYIDICLAAAIPAILYFWALFVMVDMDARASHMQGLSKEELPSKKEVFELIHIMIPIVLLVVTLSVGYSVVMAGLIGIFSSIIIAMARKSTRLSLSNIIDALYQAAQTTIVVSAACLAAGIIVGVVHQTGIGLRLSGQIFSLTQGSPIAGLLLIAFISMLLGMGMPTVPAYVITVAIGAGVLVKFGFAPIAVHMFILYYAVISCITPPIMVACYAAASIAEEDVWKVGIYAVKLAYVKYLIPFVFIFSPALLIVAVPTTKLHIIFMFVTSILGTFSVSVGISGYFCRKLSIIERLLMVLTGVLMVFPGILTDLAGLVGFVALLIANDAFRDWFFKKTRKNKAIEI